LLMSALGTDDGETLRLSQLDQMLQMILVNNGLLDDMDSRIFTPASSQQRDAFTTLRDLRRSGPFGNVSEGGQAALLGGALYEYTTLFPQCLGQRQGSGPSCQRRVPSPPTTTL